MAKAPVKLQNIRYYPYAEYTRVVLDLSSNLKISEKVIKGSTGGRLFFDLKNCRFAAAYPLEKRNEIKIKTGNLKQIRIGKLNQKTIRVVFDFDQIGKYTRFYLTSPFRIVFDIYFQDKFVSHAQESQTQLQTAATAEGNPSIARQLGLGVHRIVIDPGHGGKDPGTVNRFLGLEEKNITLDIAKRLNAILNEHAELEIILTRARDEYVALEERAAIANSNQGDIFISIHTNSAPRKTARGIEAYYLNITADPRAMEVAAQENAMSSKSMADMRTIQDQILQNSKIAESKILAQYIQDSMVGNLRTKFTGIEDLGVKKAPFYVLLGAQMPSALLEVSFLSCNDEANRLATPAYRQAIAAGLYLGIINFIQSLGK
ncbi:MAG: N-acetylmuramoyl-L-alanine amidase [Chrysiogenales bacterium]